MEGIVSQPAYLYNGNTITWENSLFIQMGQRYASNHSSPPDRYGGSHQGYPIISIVKVKQSHNNLIFIMNNAYICKDYLYIETGP